MEKLAEEEIVVYGSDHPLHPLLKYLETHSLDQLKEEHGIRFNIKGPLITLAYDQFEASVMDDLANLCRGLVISLTFHGVYLPVTDTSIVPFCDRLKFHSIRIHAFPFVRFLNFGHIADDVHNELVPTFIQEKLDGSCCIVYFVPGMGWQVGTRNVPDGSNTLYTGAQEISFRDLFEKAILAQYKFKNIDDLGYILNQNMTYVFELMTPENLVVVRHNDYRANLIGIRNNLTGQELEVSFYGKNYRLSLAPNLTQEFINDHDRPFSYEKVIDYVNARDPLTNEGVVVGFIEPNSKSIYRFKIKSEKYATYNKVQDITKYDIINYILTGEIDDFIPLMHDYQKDMVKEYSEKVSNWAKTTNHEFNVLIKDKTFETKKDLALYLLKDELVKSSKVSKNHASFIFRAYNEVTKKCDLSVLEIQSILNDKSNQAIYNLNTKHYTDSFLRTIFDWIS